MTVTTLPKIIRYGSVFDHGPCDDGPSATCPHCGSGGRYVHHFMVEDADGEQYWAAAMSGCLKLFPISPVAEADRKLKEKEEELAKKKWNTNSWQKKMRAAIDAFYAGELDEKSALQTVTYQKAAMAAYYKAKRGGRGY